MNNENKAGRRFSVRLLVFLLTSLPLFIACFAIVTIASLALKEGMETETYQFLKAMATGAEIAVESVGEGPYSLEGENVLKGGVNIDGKMRELVAHYASTNKAELTLFYGEIRRASTITNSEGKPVVGIPAPSLAVSEVLNNGNDWKSDDFIVNGDHYYVYYIPLKDDTTGKIVGMISAAKERASVQRYIRLRELFIIGTAVLIYLICITVAMSITKKSVLAPLKKLSEIAKKMARGDNNIRVERTSNDEFGDLTEDFASMVKNISNQVRITEQVAGGDLTAVCRPSSEEDALGMAIVKMLRENNRNLSTIRDAAARMSSGANEVASASNSLAQGTTQQASAIEEITASIEEIASGAKINADDANKANKLVQSTKSGAIHGNEQMQHMISAMQDINESSENISKIMKVIDDIAFQTNILALNASVEAARAGVHGKGFAVVADEVRNLASKSAEAAKDSAVMIADSIKKVEIGSKLAVETAAALEEILVSVEDIATIVSNIAEASMNQASSVGQVNAGITQIADVVQTNSATSEQCAAASAELSSLAGQLQHSVGKYKLLSGRGRNSDFDDYTAPDSPTDNESIISLDSDFGKY